MGGLPKMVLQYTQDSVKCVTIIDCEWITIEHVWYGCWRLFVTMCIMCVHYYSTVVGYATQTQLSHVVLCGQLNGPQVKPSQ